MWRTPGLGRLGLRTPLMRAIDRLTAPAREIRRALRALDEEPQTPDLRWDCWALFSEAPEIAGWVSLVRSDPRVTPPPTG